MKITRSTITAVPAAMLLSLAAATAEEPTPATTAEEPTPIGQLIDHNREYREKMLADPHRPGYHFVISECHSDLSLYPPSSIRRGQAILC